MPRSSALLSLASALLTSVFFSGCGSTPTRPADTTTVTSQPVTTPVNTDSALDGNVHGGTQPVVGAHIYLFAANTTGYGAPSLSLLNTSQPGVASDATGNYVLTDSSGNFHLTGDYTCTSGQQVYMLATGGNPGLPNGTTNPLLTLMSVLGACPSGATSFADVLNFISINEVTTVASVYALSGYMTDATHISSSGTPASLQGIANAFLTFSNLAYLPNGEALTQNATGSGEVPQAEINALANILVPCINSNGSTSECPTLFSNAKSTTGNLPADPVTALLNIAHNPAANVATLYNIGNANPTYTPTLTSVPADWTLSIVYYADNMTGPYFPAIDSTGNLWVPGFASNSLTEFDPLGNVLSGEFGFGGASSGLNLPYSIAIDAHDNAWTVNFGPLGDSTISKFLSNGNVISTTPYACSSACYFLAFDSSQNLWASGATQTTVLQSSGAILTHFPTNADNSGVAIDSTGNAWTIGQPNRLFKLSLPAVLSPIPESVTASTGSDLTTIAIDSADNVWFVSGANNAIGKFDKTGNAISPSTGYTGGGLNGPAQIAIDGSNRAWVVNRNSNTLSAFNNDGTPISPSTGYQAASLSGPRGLAIDGAGNVWITNFTYNSITEFVGIATPVSTPITPTTHGQRP